MAGNNNQENVNPEELNAKAEAEKAEAEVKAAETGATEEKVKTTNSNKKPKKEELVEITLPFIKGNTHMTVSLNGVVTRIERGKPVKVSKGIAEIINNSVAQDNKTAMMMAKLQKQAEKQ